MLVGRAVGRRKGGTRAPRSSKIEAWGGVVGPGSGTAVEPGTGRGGCIIRPATSAGV